MIIPADGPDELNWRRAGEPLEPKDFARRAEAIIEAINDKRSELGLNGAINEAIERYVDDEPHPELERFARAISLARRQAMIQQWLDDDREKLHHGHLDHYELKSLGHHYETLREEACMYNHLLRSVIEVSGRYFSRDDLLGWLVGVSQGRAEWAQGEITGAISEVALHAALQGMPELVGLRYGTIEEDLSGYDFLCEYEGKTLSIDAKTGRYWPLSERKHGHRHLEVSVPREALEDFKLTRHGINRLREEVRQALHGNARQPDYGQYQHEHHGHPHHVKHAWNRSFA